MRRLIKEIKYRGSFDMVGELVSLWEVTCGATVTQQHRDTVVTAVPMWAPKQKKRGFNQAELIAREIAERWGLRYTELLMRTRDTRPMYGLSKQERAENVQGAFALKIHKSQMLKLAQSNVILVDDVWTTGATMRECRKVLTTQNVTRVDFVTIAC